MIVKVTGKNVFSYTLLGSKRITVLENIPDLLLWHLQETCFIETNEHY